MGGMSSMGFSTSMDARTLPSFVEIGCTSWWWKAGEEWISAGGVGGRDGVELRENGRRGLRRTLNLDEDQHLAVRVTNTKLQPCGVHHHCGSGHAGVVYMVWFSVLSISLSMIVRKMLE